MIRQTITDPRNRHAEPVPPDRPKGTISPQRRLAAYFVPALAGYHKAPAVHWIRTSRGSRTVHHVWAL